MAEGEPGLVDRSSRPHHSPARLDAADEGVIDALRRQRLSSPAIARRLGRFVSTIGQVLRRHRLGHLRPRPPSIHRPLRRPAARRGSTSTSRRSAASTISDTASPATVPAAATGAQQRLGRRPRKLRRLHVATDDPSRPGPYSAAPQRAPGNSTPAWLKQHDVTVERVMTDHGPAYKSRLFAAALVHHGIARKRAQHPQDRWQGRALHPERHPRLISASPLKQLSRPPGRHASWLLACNTARLHSALGGNHPAAG